MGCVNKSDKVWSTADGVWSSTADGVWSSTNGYDISSNEWSDV